MSKHPVVKEWKPKEGCKNCKDLKRIYESNMKGYRDLNALGIKKIKEQDEEIKACERVIIRMANQITLSCQLLGGDGSENLPQLIEEYLASDATKGD